MEKDENNKKRGKGRTGQKKKERLVKNGGKDLMRDGGGGGKKKPGKKVSIWGNDTGDGELEGGATFS